MPVYRTPDGKIVEEKTVKEAAPKQSDMPPPPPAGGDDATEFEGDSGFDAPTKRLEDDPNASPPGGAESGAGAAAPEEDGKTRLVGAKRRKKKAEGEEEGPADAMDDPLVGWLVVAEGPGQGNGLKLGYGANSLGRGPDQRICLDFGDNQISREKHAIVTYDPRSRKWFVQQGGGKNLTYRNGEPVLQATEVSAQDDIQIGDTTLKLVPFCGPDFDWQDKEETE